VIRKITELLLMIWKAVLRGVDKLTELICGKPEEPAPKPADAKAPYRTEPTSKPEPAKPEAEKPKFKLVCTLTNEDRKTKEEIQKIKVKSRRRALRHFQGKEVKHRVTEKTPDAIEFEFFRSPDKSRSVKIRWQKAKGSSTSNEKPAETGS